MTDQHNNPARKPNSDSAESEAEQVTGKPSDAEFDLETYQQIMQKLRDRPLLDRWIVASFDAQGWIKVQDQDAKDRMQSRTQIGKIDFKEIVKKLRDQKKTLTTEAVAHELKTIIVERAVQEVDDLFTEPEQDEASAESKEQAARDFYRAKLFSLYERHRLRGQSQDDVLVDIENMLKQAGQKDPSFLVILEIFRTDSDLKELIEEFEKGRDKPREEKEEAAEPDSDDGDTDEEDSLKKQNEQSAAAVSTQAAQTLTTQATKTGGQKGVTTGAATQKREIQKTELQSLKLSYQEIRALTQQQVLSHLLVFNRLVLKSGIAWGFELTASVTYLLCRLHGIRGSDQESDMIKVDASALTSSGLNAKKLFQAIENQVHTYGYLDPSITTDAKSQLDRTRLQTQLEKLKRKMNRKSK